MVNRTAHCTLCHKSRSELRSTIITSILVDIYPVALTGIPATPAAGGWLTARRSLTTMKSRSVAVVECLSISSQLRLLRVFPPTWRCISTSIPCHTLQLSFSFYPHTHGQLTELQWGLCALRNGNQNSMEAILACHPALSTEWVDWVAKWCELWRIRTGPIYIRWGLCEYVIVHTILGGSPVIL